MTTHYSDEQVAEYAKSRNLVPGTLLWASDIPLSEDAFRSGAKNSPETDFVRFKDVSETTTRTGRIPAEESDDWVIAPGQGISLFIKQMLLGMVHLGTVGAPGTQQRGDLKKQYDPFKERYWWKIEKGQVLPAGLQLVYDGEPPGHCILTVERPMTVKAFLALVAHVHFQSMGTDYYGILKS
ncbi:MAG: hypothetical protein ACTHL8_05340 [Burkholderiaceae bacterium]